MAERSTRGRHVSRKGDTRLRLRKRWLLAPAVLVAAALVAAACTGGGGGQSNEDTEGDETPTPGASPSQDSFDEEDDIPEVSGWNTDWSKKTISLSELFRGIFREDPRDAIPPIDEPALETVAEASEWLAEREPVVALELEGEARAYPLRILTSHEVVNDVVGGRAVVITYCPLCNSALTFDREVGGQVLRFGVSGLLRNSDLVMWDRQTESLWQQITGEGIVGELAGTQLEFIPAPIISWEDFRERFPDGRVLSRRPGDLSAEPLRRAALRGLRHIGPTVPFQGRAGRSLPGDGAGRGGQAQWGDEGLRVQRHLRGAGGER